MTTKMTLASAKREAGFVSTGNSKMPGSSFAIDPFQCKTGAKLVDVKGSTCSRCYAIKIAKLRPSVRQSYVSNMEKALAGIGSNFESWARSIAFQIDKAVVKTGQPFHRWFDAGDLQSAEMLDAICRVAELTPRVKHWLPTREAKIYSDWLKSGKRLPDNLIVRVSATMIDGKPSNAFEHTSTVSTKASLASNKFAGQICEASTRGGMCGPCRACWSTNVANVTYPVH